MSRDPFADLAAITRRDEPMARHTSFGVGGPVRYFVEPRNWQQLRLVHRRSVNAGLRFRIFGRGSNTLVTDEPHPWVVVSTAHLSKVERRGNRLTAGAGVFLPRLVTRAADLGLGGLEGLAGIPGSVGGAVAMNAGGRDSCVADHLLGAVVVSPGGEPRWAEAAELGFRYRYSIVPKAGLVVLSATFELDSKSPSVLRDLRRGYLDAKHASQPMDALSAGCIFKNPRRRIDGVRRSAGWLIDQAGLKGTRIGGAIVSPKHANFIVNDGTATAQDILDLIALVRERVREVFNVTLRLEIEVWSNKE